MNGNRGQPDMKLRFTRYDENSGTAFICFHIATYFQSKACDLAILQITIEGGISGDSVFAKLRIAESKADPDFSGRTVWFWLVSCTNG